MAKKKIELIDRDLSWLSFNARVLQEAEDRTVPLLERFKFLGIFSNNRDEFFRVRVATIRRMALFGKKGKQLLGADPDKLLEKIQRVVIGQQRKFEVIYKELLKELEKEKIFLINETELNKEQGEYVRSYFHESVYPFLVPIMIDTAPKFPYLKDKPIYLAVNIISYTASKAKTPQKNRGNVKGKKSTYALIEIPTDVVSRFLVLPPVADKKYIILLDDVIRYCLDDVFATYHYDKIESYTLKLTRDAELDIDTDISSSWMEKVEKSVKQRKKGAPVRVAYDEKMPADLLAFILKKIKLQKEEYLIPGGRYHNFKDFINFPRIGRKELSYQIPAPLDHADLKGERSLFHVIRKKDVLLAFPYHSFHHITDLIREASIDPKVKAIKMTLYRSAKDSSVVNALINGIKNGKQVTVVVEIQARFDEESNIFYATKLQEEGAKVIFGVPGLKVHSKLCLISRKEGDKMVNYAHIGTGNFNEQTARVYCDHSLLTCDKHLTREVEKLFEFYQDNYKTGSYKHLIVSPFNTRKKFIGLINQEIKNAEEGKQAWMMLKMNSLVDHEMIEKLYEASDAGVKIKMIVRGICSLVTGVKGMSDNIEIISIVDKFLEHSRIFVFCNDGAEKYFISSGDWMYRNLDHRSEVAVPILDKALQKQLMNYLQIQFHDNTKARVINRLQDNKYVVPDNGRAVRAQDDIYRWIIGKFDPEKQFENSRIKQFEDELI
jgi:polyphosphate kinase